MTDKEKIEILSSALKRIMDFAIEPGADPMPVIVEMQTIAEDALEQSERPV